MKLLNLLPFMDDEDIKELVNKIKTKEVKGVKLVHLYPFLESNEVDELVDEIVKDGNKKDLYTALPFMSRQRLNKLYEEVKEGKVEGFKEQALLPFLGQSKIKELVEAAIKKGFDENLEDIDEKVAEKVEKAVEKAFEE
ncbi:hypothetical protein KQ51_01407 [Candidatus Izimaplasma bacterium HR1]|jgi:hypothetical protein|uniref:hypothetical protein n=1 Tax=Candidatus Izimoplasma sp. HR1 TaxID=1541959 RepID=UPI0004F832DC|nr:hypothetical protein KQ51_01407 [Candidatus Izimaplasma bacterium HR1]